MGHDFFHDRSLAKMAKHFHERELPQDLCFVYALSKTAVNSMLCQNSTNIQGTFEGVDDFIWPRTLQMINLSPKSDLVGGLMDFDISLTACAYDGTVRVTRKCNKYTIAMH